MLTKLRGKFQTRGREGSPSSAEWKDRTLEDSKNPALNGFSEELLIDALAESDHESRDFYWQPIEDSTRPECLSNIAQANGADQMIGSCDSFPKAGFFLP